MRNFLAALLGIILSTAAFAQTGPTLATLPTSPALLGVPNWIYGSFTPSGTTSTSYVMLGVANQTAGNIILAPSLTPVTSGAILVTVTGEWKNSVSGDGCQIEPGWGTGTAPANGAAVPATFTPMTASPAWTALANAAPLPFSRTFMFQATTLNVPVYADVAFQAVTGGTCTLSPMEVSMMELS
jgi:hypothetical protein